jgi:hypothetical protein
LLHLSPSWQFFYSHNFMHCHSPPPCHTNSWSSRISGTEQPQAEETSSGVIDMRMSSVPLMKECD